MQGLEKQIEELIFYINDFSFEELVSNEKIIIRDFLRKKVSMDIIDSYALDYKDEEFRVSLIKGKDEKIILVKKDGVIRWN